MKTVYLVRHAKSSWDFSHLDDRERPLKGRGIRDAQAMSNWLIERSSERPTLFSSPATRAWHTALIFARNFQISAEAIQAVESLYGATPEEVKSFLRTLPEQESLVMLFSHNPTIELFLRRCVPGGVSRVPTTGMACLRFATESWKDLDFEAELLFFEFPKNLKET